MYFQAAISHLNSNMVEDLRSPHQARRNSERRIIHQQRGAAAMQSRKEMMSIFDAFKDELTANTAKVHNKRMELKEFLVEVMVPLASLAPESSQSG